MCGISGIVNFKDQIDRQELIRITEALKHRGPNDHGIEILNAKNAQIGLGHQRLSIIDLSDAGHQPFKYENLTLVYNGEIYNYKEIRKELEKKQYIFITNTDTEVLIKAFHAWGENCVEKFNGMFAFLIYDSAEQELFYARDRAGVKPLYVSTDINGKIIFSSELKSFHCIDKFKPTLDEVSAKQYFQLGYVAGPRSIIKGIRKVTPGHIYRLNLRTREIIEKRYWDPISYYNYERGDNSISYANSLDMLDEIITSSCEMRLIADVPVGVFLSGGYDSSLISAIISKKLGKKIGTFTLGFEDKQLDESNEAREIANYLGTDHVEYVATQHDFERIIPKLPEIWDEPISDTSTISTRLVSELAAKHVTAVLSADGGDEIFGGYDKYQNILKLHEFLNNRKFGAFAGSLPALSTCLSYISNHLASPKYSRRINKFLSLCGDYSLGNIFYTANMVFNRGDLDKYLRFGAESDLGSFADFCNLNPDVDDLNKILAIDYKTYQADNILVKVDRATMSVGIESREPLLDYRIIEFSSKLPASFKYNNGVRKRILKDIVHKYIPERLVNRPKKGFGSPIEKWLKNSQSSLVDEFLDPKYLRNSGLYNVEAILQLKNYFRAGVAVDSQKIWSILNFEMWRSHWKI